MTAQIRMTAHIRNDGTEQSVEEHCEGTAARAEAFAKDSGLGGMARAAGLLHDIGKLSAGFQSYIHEEKDFAKGSIDHSCAGGKYLCELSESDRALRGTAAFLARVILSHHGLHDWVDENGKDAFDRRVGKDDRYEEIRKNAQSLRFMDQIPSPDTLPRRIQPPQTGSASARERDRAVG